MVAGVVVGKRVVSCVERQGTMLVQAHIVIRDKASKLGVDVEESEIIGAIPLLSLAGHTPESILWKRFRPQQILENW